jgi:predicted metalloprotease with PDZ domain
VFDYGQYTFLASINPYVKGDGMEHRNSTMIALPVAFDGSDNLLGVFSHEFFHTWNVERIRPKTLEPFNFEKSNMSFELWFAEGFTQYYGELLLARAGFNSPEEYSQTLSSLVNTKENTAGAKRISPVEASCQAVFVDAGVAIDKTNYPNTYTSYYPYGASIALALDLELRTRGLTLDGFMQAVWQKHGKPELAYEVGDLQQVLAAYAKDKAFADGFFAKYVNGHESFNYAPLLQMAGLTLKKQFPEQAWIGDVRFKEGAGLTILSNTIINSPL